MHAKSWEQPGVVDYVEKADLAERYKGSDVYTLRVQQHVSVTPLSLDLTSRVDLAELERLLRNSVVK